MNDKLDKLWQKPRQGQIFYLDEEWYEPRPVGHEPLERFMKYLNKDANLSTNIYTNHSIRATCIGTLDKGGFEARHITAVSGHKSEATVRTYSTKCPENKKKEMANALADSINPKKMRVAETVSRPDAQIPVTINMEQLKDITNTNTEQKTDTLPPNFQLVPFDTESDDDDILMRYLDNQNFDNMLPQLTKTTSNTNSQMTKTSNTLTNTMPIMPKMYFPNSNVTINYNFSK